MKESSSYRMPVMPTMLKNVTIAVLLIMCVASISYILHRHNSPEKFTQNQPAKLPISEFTYRYMKENTSADEQSQ